MFFIQIDAEWSNQNQKSLFATYKWWCSRLCKIFMFPPFHKFLHAEKCKYTDAVNNNNLA